MCRARLTAVGADSFVSRLTLDAKAQKKRQAKGMMKALNDLVKWIGIGIIPMGVLLVVKEVHWLGRSIPAGVTSTVGALVGMIPEGVYLLTSLALVAGVLRLAQKKTMCREMDCIETLARVDTLCVDKTGTVTENKMIVDDIVPLCPDRFIAEDIHMIMADYCAAMRGDNDTMAAMRKFFTGEVNQRATAALPFTSAKNTAAFRSMRMRPTFSARRRSSSAANLTPIGKRSITTARRAAACCSSRSTTGSSPMKRSPPSACPSRSYCSPTDPRERRIRSRGLRARAFPCA